MTRVAASRKRMHSIMANARWSDLTWFRNGYKIIVPQKYITREGRVYKRINKHIVEENFEKLKELGVAIL